MSEPHGERFPIIDGQTTTDSVRRPTIAEKRRRARIVAAAGAGVVAVLVVGGVGLDNAISGNGHPSVDSATRIAEDNAKASASAAASSSAAAEASAKIAAAISSAQASVSSAAAASLSSAEVSQSSASAEASASSASAVASSSTEAAPTTSAPATTTQADSSALALAPAPAPKPAPQNGYDVHPDFSNSSAVNSCTASDGQVLEHNGPFCANDVVHKASGAIKEICAVWVDDPNTGGKVEWLAVKFDPNNPSTQQDNAAYVAASLFEDRVDVACKDGQDPANFGQYQ